MTTIIHTATPVPPTVPAAPARRWWALACISVAQLMVALDATVINIALPSAQRALQVSAADRQWVVTAYTLAFGGLLLLGGRLADGLGRRRTFLAGLLGFAAASAVGGAAPDFAVLLAARATQGAFAALLSPTALSMLAVTFTEPKERAKAFAVFGAIAGTGGALGLLLGGALTEWLQWRWCLFVNVPIAIAAFAAGRTVLPVIPTRREAPLDVPGVVLVGGGLVAVVYGFSRAATAGWPAPSTLVSLAGGATLLFAFVTTQARRRAPLLPLRIVADRTRGGAYLAIGLAVVAMYGLFLLLSYDLQVVRHWSPLRTGIAFLPLSAATMVSSTTISRALLPKVPPRWLLAPGLLLGATGMAVLTRLGVHAGYLTQVLPAEILLGLGMGAVFVPAFSLATAGVSPQEAGVASAVANTAQQIGASLGTALLNTVAAAAATTFLAAHAPARLSPTIALVHGYRTAAGVAALVLAGAALAAGAVVKARPESGGGYGA